MQIGFRSLRTRLLLTFLGFSLITILVILLSIWFYNKSSRLNGVNSDMEQALLKTLKMIKVEQDFFSYETYREEFYETGKSNYLQEHAALVGEVRKQLYALIEREEVEDLNIEKDYLIDKIKVITYNLERYEATFSRIVELIRKRGFKDKGLEGEMRDQIHQIEELNYGLPLNNILSLRRQEKDYFIRKDTIYAAQLIENASNLKTSILSNPDLPFWQKQKASLLLDNYVDIFRKIVSIETLMGKNNQVGERGKMRKYAETSINRIQDLLNGIKKEVENIQDEQTNAFLLLSGFAVLLSLLLSYLVSSFVTRPISRLSQAINHTVKNNFENIQLVENTSHDEVGKLTHDFNLMLQELKMRVQEIQEKSVELEQQNEELSQTNTKISQSEQRLERLNAVKDNFFSIISHDLRSPLNSILGFMNILENHANSFKPEEMQKFAQDTRGHVNRIIELLENLLQWSLSQTGDISFKPEALVLADFARENANLYQKTAQEKKVQLRVEVNEKYKVRADANMLNFIFRNLISNAIKFSRTDSEVQIVAKSMDTKIEVSVIDQGIGIDEEDLKKIFEPGLKHTTEGTSQEKGTGFGLQVCKNFVEMNHGSLRLESEVQKGTRVIFTLPKT